MLAFITSRKFISNYLRRKQREYTNWHLLSCRHSAGLVKSAPVPRPSGLRSLLHMSPDQVVLTVKASFAIKKSPTNAGHAFELLFDSFVQPMPPGARTSVVSGRQLLYRIGSVYVDMEVDKRANSDRASLVGQMLDSARPGHPLAGIPVALFERKRSIARTSSNDNGEFHLEFDMKSDLKLCVSLDSDCPVHLPITCMESKLSSPTQEKKRRVGAGVGANWTP